MATTDRPAAPGTARKPRDSELDVFGLTHQGRVRKENQDHFLLSALTKRMEVRLTSLPEAEALVEAERLAFLAMVADGVGGGHAGEEASRLTVAHVAEYLAHSVRCWYGTDPTDEELFMAALHDAAMRVHMELADGNSADPTRRGMATTLTLWIGVWPRAYLLQVGDSRCYILRGGVLTQISRDQTMAQDLVDQGVLTRTDAARTRWAHTLSSAIGGSQAAPVVSRLDQAWGDVGLLCSDGLTNHVPDERIRERLQGMSSARQVCEDLLQDALDGGGSDNITIVVGRAVPEAE